MTDPISPGVDSGARDANAQHAYAAATAANGYAGINGGLPGAAADTDSDGLTDDLEMLAGTNPSLADNNDHDHDNDNDNDNIGGPGGQSRAQ